MRIVYNSNNSFMDDQYQKGLITREELSYLCDRNSDNFLDSLRFVDKMVARRKMNAKNDNDQNDSKSQTG